MSVTGRVFTLFRPILRLSLLSKNSRSCGSLSIYSKFKYSTCNCSWQRGLFNKTIPIQKSFISSCVGTMEALSPLDPSSYSRPEIAVVQHISLALNVDFEKKVLSGSALLTVNIIEDTAEVILDASNLTIHSIELDDGTPLKYTLGDNIPNFGSKLTVKLPKTEAGETSAQPFTAVGACTALSFDDFCYNIGLKKIGMCSCYVCRTFGQEEQTEIKSRVKIKIQYAASKTASALQWLEPSQTSGKKHPYLFSQCQPIHARSIMPCQDTPAVKFTYDAEVTAPEEFTVLMSAIKGEQKNAKATFRQPVPIPSYLLAIAVGVLESRELGPRSRVWSEKEMVDRSAYEFAETEKYLQAAEKLCGEYVWTQYDLLVLPPSFPYGGMENPCLTFVTPTLLAGDRSLADVIVHEIMHSWTGNLVTNRNFEHFWLNEGFTVFLERKVGASLIADASEAKKSRDFYSLLGLQDLTETINDQLKPTNQLTKLVVDLDGVHPDDAFSTVPYEKGSLFLRYLEDLLGGPEVFDDFLRSYLNHFARKSLDTDQFKTYLLKYFSDNEKLKAVDWNAWLYTCGMPPIIPNYDPSMTKDVNTLLEKINQDHEFSHDEIKSFTPHQMIHLLQGLIDRPPLPVDSLRSMGHEYRIDSSKNAEIQYRWVRLCVRSKYLDKLSDAFNFVNSQGRMKYVRPVYRDLYAWEEVRDQAINNFLENEKNMMHVTAYTVRKDLHLSE